MTARTRAIALAMLALVCGTHETGAQDFNPAVAFGTLPNFSDAAISPSGTYLAVVQNILGHYGVAIYSFADQGAKPAVLASRDLFVRGAAWVSDERLILFASKNERVRYDIGMRSWERAISVTPQADGFVILMHNLGDLGVNVSAVMIAAMPPRDPRHILMPAWKLGVSDQDFRYDLFRVDVATGDADLAQRGGIDTVEWILDTDGRIVARIDRTEQLQDKIFRFDEGDWNEIAHFDAHGGGEAGVAGLTSDGTALALVGRFDSDLGTLYPLDLATGVVGAPIFRNARYDVTGVLMNPWIGRVAGATYDADKTEYHYFDPSLARAQHRLEDAFPGLSVAILSYTRNMELYVARVSGPQHPPTLHLLNLSSGRLDQIGQAYEQLAGVPLGAMRSYSYKARDGVQIPAYLTLPPGRSPHNLPAIVLPHGGPSARDTMDFDWWTQFLAHQGYAVLQPNFRGSQGYGYRFLAAGFGQWGARMQDDVSDGVKQLIADGIADPKRICIVGASYGGYAALAGATLTPDLYACAVSVAGLSDLPLMLSDTARLHSKEVYSYWESRIGARSADAERLRAVSPALHADAVRAPVLLIHGDRDTTVPLEQSTRMHEALQRAGKQVEFVTLEGDDHYLSTAATRTRLLQEIGRFLTAHIGN